MRTQGGEGSRERNHPTTCVMVFTATYLCLLPASREITRESAIDEAVNMVASQRGSWKGNLPSHSGHPIHDEAVRRIFQDRLMSYALLKLVSPAGKALPRRKRVQIDVHDIFDSGEEGVHETSIKFGRTGIAAHLGQGLPLAFVDRHRICQLQWVLPS